MKSKKTWRILGIASVLAALFLLLAIAGMAIGQIATDAPEMSIVAANLSFSDSVYIKYAVSFENIDDDENVKLLVWSAPHDDYTLGTQTVSLESDGTTTVSGKECLVFDYRKLAAKQMTDYVYARAVYEKNGSTYYSDVKKYSVLTYVYNKLGYTGTATQNEDLKALLEGLLEYGASAQNYFNYNTSALATAKYVKVSLTDGVFADGCSTTLAQPGTELTITAISSVENGGFAYWTNESGDIISKSSSYTMTVGNVNTQLKAVYDSYKGGYVEGAGATLSDGSFAMTEHAVNTDSVIDITASGLETLLAGELDEGKTYRVTDETAVNITANVNGNGAAVIVPAGLVINSANNVSVNNLIVVAPVSVNASTNVTFTQVDITGAITLDSSSDSIKLDNCRITSDSTAVLSGANNLTLLNSYVKGTDAVAINGNGSTVYNCVIIADNAGVTVAAEDAAINNNTVTAVSDGIYVSDGSVNTLVSFNSVSGVEKSVRVGEALNTSVLFNSAYSIAAENSTNTYIVKNGLNGKLVLTSNNYLLCDNNTEASDGKDHSPSMSGNTNVNGNDITDVDARADVGANEDILPHTNKDLFLGMTPKSTVKDAVGGTSLTLGQYILTNSADNNIVIVPPGYYTIGDHYTFLSTHSNTEIYAYGVYNEREFEGANVQSLAFQFGGAKNVEIHGITVGYNHQSAGQVHVLTKARTGSSWSGYTYNLTLVSAAGYLDSFGSLDTTKFASGNFDLVKQGETHWSSYNYSALTANDDGTMTMTVTQDAYNNIVAGDVLYCRLAGENQSTIYFGSGADNITLKDCTIYGYAAALAIVPASGSGSVTLERVHNTVHSPYVIDKTTYDKYEAWESSYGVELVSIDEEGRYRGSTPIVGSVDATHVNGGNEGIKAVSCLFENMCDDGSNHRGTSSRLHGYKVNSDGTVTLYIKANIAEYYRSANINKGVTSVTSNPVGIAEGENIYIYTSKGELFCDTTTLTASSSTGTSTSISYSYTHSGTAKTLTYTLPIYEVNVDADACNFDALEGYDLTNNDYAMSQKVLVDNISRNGSGGHFDNVLIQNFRSRGFLVKSTDITIEHCTFRNVAMTGVLMSIEPTWGESTVSRNILVKNTLFDTTGFRSDSYDSSPTLAPIAISSLATYGNHALDSIRSENIVIEGNEFRNYGHSYGIYVNGAKDVHILNNVFAPKNASTSTQYVNIVTAADIEISGNKKADGSLITVTSADDAAYIHGDNVSGSSLSGTDIFVNGKHLIYYHPVAENSANSDIADSMASALSRIDNYMITSAKKTGDYTILLVARDNVSEALNNKNYTVSCSGNTLTVTAETRGALAYAAIDFAERLAEITAKTYEIKSGDSFDYTFTTDEIPATDTSIFKYVGMWQATDANNPTTMVSYWDSAYVEFDFTGTSATILFSSPSKCNVSIDGGEAKSYTVQDELTISVNTAGTHTVRVHYGDKSAHMYFAGVRVPAGQTVSRTADKPLYIQFVGDSISDSPLSFSHNVADILGWDYSVIACEAVSLQADKGYWRYNNGFTNPDVYAEGSMAYLLNKNFGTVSIGMEDAFFKLGIPNKNFPAAGSDEFNDIAANYYTEKYDFNFNTGYTPDIVFIFLGTNDLSASSTQTDIDNFVATYKEFVANILAKYGSNTKICAMQAISTSDASNMYDTTHPRYVAIAQAASELETLYGDKFNFIDAETVQSWSIEFDAATDATHPTEDGYAKLTSGVARYLFSAYVDQSFINHEFSISGIRKYNDSSWGGRDSAGNDNGIAYSHFELSQSGHINISGQNDNSWSFSAMTNYNENRAVTINGSTGQYLVLMYRASGSHDINLELRTTSSDDKSSLGTDTLSRVTKPMGLVSTDWEFAVVDLSQFANYTCNATDLRVQVRITTSMTSFDIAYAGIVDSVEEAALIAQFKLSQGKYTVYKDFSATGETFYLTEEAYMEDYLASLEYVNHIYDINGMTAFLNINNVFSQPTPEKGLVENGITFTRLSYTGGYGHVFVNGSNYLSMINGSTGNYLLIKYRASGNSNLNLELRTGESTDETAGANLSSVNRTAANIVANTWEFAVIDLAQFANYERDTEGKYVQVRISTGMDTLDIAHVAIVDSITEAEYYISVVSTDTTYVLYEDWSTTGVAHTID